MSQTTTTTARKFACTAPTPCGFPLPCPRCGEANATVAVRLYGLEDDNCFTCCECDGEFSFAEMRHLVNAWARTLDWLATAPDMSDIGEDGLPAEQEEAGA